MRYELLFVSIQSDGGCAGHLPRLDQHFSAVVELNTPIPILCHDSVSNALCRKAGTKRVFLWSLCMVDPEVAPVSPNS